MIEKEQLLSHFEIFLRTQQIEESCPFSMNYSTHAYRRCVFAELKN